MVEHVYTMVWQAKLVEDVIVATDDDRIFNTVAKFGGKALITSAANRSGTDRLAEAGTQDGPGSRTGQRAALDRGDGDLPGA